MNRQKTSTLINLVESAEKRFRIETVNEQLYGNLDMDFCLEIAKIVSKRNSVPEYDAKNFIAEHLSKFSHIKILNKDSEEVSFASVLYDFAISVSKNFPQNGGERAFPATPLPGLDFYDNRRDTDGQYETKYGIFHGDDLGSKS